MTALGYLQIWRSRGWAFWFSLLHRPVLKGSIRGCWNHPVVLQVSRSRYRNGRFIGLLDAVHLWFTSTSAIHNLLLPIWDLIPVELSLTFLSLRRFSLTFHELITPWHGRVEHFGDCTFGLSIDGVATWLKWLSTPLAITTASFMAGRNSVFVAHSARTGHTRTWFKRMFRNFWQFKHAYENRRLKYSLRDTNSNDSGHTGEQFQFHVLSLLHVMELEEFVTLRLKCYCFNIQKQFPPHFFL